MDFKKLKYHLIIATRKYDQSVVGKQLNRDQLMITSGREKGFTDEVIF